MKKSFRGVLALMLSAAVCIYAGDDEPEVPLYTVTLSAEYGQIAAQGYVDQGCHFSSESDSKIILKCPEDAEFEFWASKRGYRIKCWKTSHDDCITIESDAAYQMKVKSDTALTAIFEEKPLEMNMGLFAAENYQFPVYGQNTFYFVGRMDGGPRDAYVSFQYDNGKGFRNVMDPVKIPKEKLSGRIIYADSVFTAYFSSTFEGVFNVNGTEKKISFKGEEHTAFRLAASYNSSAITNFNDDVVYSMKIQINWLHHIVFRSVSGTAISDHETNYGKEWYLPSDRDKIEVPDDDDKYVYDYRWHRIGASGEEYLSSDVEKIIVGDSVHYQAEIIRHEKTSSSSVKVTSSSSVKAESSSSVKVASSSSSSKVTSSSSYDINELPEIAFTVIGLEADKKVEDINVKTPNDCFSITEMILSQRSSDKEQKITEGPIWATGGSLFMSVSVSDIGACANDELANIWRYFRNDHSGAVIYTVNGKKGLVIATYESRVIYQFDAKDVNPKSSSSVASSSSSSAKATSSSSSAKSVKSSSSSKGAKSSSSSKKSGKSSSSKGSKESIFVHAQLPHFSVNTVGRDIQIVHARVGSAYAVFDMQGRVLRVDLVSSENFNLTVPSAGTYLVRVGSQSRKVNIK